MRRYPVTIALVLANVLAYIWEVTSGTNFDSNQSLVDHGALYGPLVQQGQWWRVISGAFLHAGLAHIALNMFALYQLGTFVERALGPWRMFLVYAIALVGGGLAVVYFDPQNPTVGASGAIFGLFGALLAIGVRLGKRGRSLIAQTAPILVINLVFTFAVPFISKAGHLGGLVSGFVAGLVLFAMQPRPPAPAVVDAATGEEIEGEYIEPSEPNAARTT
jgi:membrane associated rhomboid family serine protease